MDCFGWRTLSVRRQNDKRLIGGRSCFVNRWKVTVLSPDGISGTLLSGGVRQVIGMDVVFHPCLATIPLAEQLVAVDHRFIPQLFVFGRCGVETGFGDFPDQGFGKTLDFVLFVLGQRGSRTQIHPDGRLRSDGCGGDLILRCLARCRNSGGIR